MCAQAVADYLEAIIETKPESIKALMKLTTSEVEFIEVEISPRDIELWKEMVQVLRDPTAVSELSLWSTNYALLEKYRAYQEFRKSPLGTTPPDEPLHWYTVAYHTAALWIMDQKTNMRGLGGAGDGFNIKLP